jgi:REP element-mobilizing transposase RayT
MSPTSKSRANDGPLPDPLAFLLTWTTYGTWLPGDARGWTDKKKGKRERSPRREADARRRMTESRCLLSDDERNVVETTVADHCRKKRWELFAVNCRTNHVHVVVAGSFAPKKIREQLMAWCTRKLKELQEQAGRTPEEIRENWWTELGSERFLNDEDALEAAILYVKYGQ